MREPVIHKLLTFLTLIDAGCPVGRHELTNGEWLALEAVKSERERIAAEELKEKRAREGNGEVR